VLCARRTEAWRELFSSGRRRWRDEWLGELEASTEKFRRWNSARCLEKLPASRRLRATEVLHDVLNADDDENWPRGTKGSVRGPLKKFFEEAEFLGALLPARRQ